ncbi:hypothetical protein pEaSNUABM35_00053 [Erwinia phage pEa_SNUABM_35]|uniref:Uncharacterized protein n=1 Tax=Erwinia phage pEa_SNUABM_35 TaxID=2869557 RepID=A0AAE7XQW2_9CAUD|nr:hypothetical protein MPK65_gp053 [Erwinia phage pEa_SNUABM_35]QZE59970.1 hypothetical protein pEaSNUABM35_00053 [Erwinia phage pEa_SNUABM_35]QZE60306.1 hypothetical protein pEaSNUABM36_00053 [Erwinia phage pEa_SNUABM_36]
MEKNTDEKIVVLDKDMFGRLLSYAQVGERECGENFFGRSVAQIKKHVARFNIHQRTAMASDLRDAKLYKAERRRFVKKASRLSSQRETVRYMVDHQHRLIFPVKIVGKSSHGAHRLKYVSLCDGWPGDAVVDYIFETREELPADYRVLQEGERIE